MMIGYKSPVARIVPQPVTILLCSLWFYVTIVFTACLSVIALPSFRLRTCLTKVWIALFMPAVHLFFGLRLEVSGVENLGSLPDRPVVYVGNHSSTLDFILSTRVTSMGTAAVAKRELLWQPIGWMAWMCGSMFIDRSDPQRAIASMNDLAHTIQTFGVSTCVYPEGTRSKDGRLKPFKKGAFHIARQARVPVVPIVTIGAHKVSPNALFTRQRRMEGRASRDHPCKGAPTDKLHTPPYRTSRARSRARARALAFSCALRQIWGKSEDPKLIKVNAEPVRIKILAPIDTNEWSVDNMEEKTRMVHALFIDALPKDQRPSKAE